MGTYTPGPWHLDRALLHDAEWLVTSSPGENGKVKGICCVWKTDDRIPSMHRDTTGIANAQLIAAAPRMIAALKRVIQDRDADGRLSLSELALAIAEDAIAEAEGNDAERQGQ